MIDSNFLLRKTTEYFEVLQSQKRYEQDLVEESLEESAMYAITKKAYKTAVFDLEKAKFVNDETTVLDLEQRVKTYKAILDKLRGHEEQVASLPNCAICNDYGSVDGKPCKCFFQKLNQFAYEFLDVKERKLKSFKDDTLSFVVNTEKFMHSFMEYAKNFSLNSKSIVLSGERGTGKTFLAECVANELNQNGFNAIFLTSFEFNDIFLKTFSMSNQEKLVIKEILTSCDLLVIDDLGSEQLLNKITVESLLMILSQRISQNAPFLITTNLSFEEISLRYGERLSSRLLTAIHPVLNGVDLRKLRKQ